MAVLYGTQSDGTLIPVQADSQGRLVAVQAGLDQVVNGDLRVTGDLQASSLNGGQFAGFRNWIINGNFTVNQRGGTRTPGVGVYGFDRWKGHAQGLEQIVEALPAGEYTLSWSGGGSGVFAGTTAASPITATVNAGDTSVVVPSNASLVQLEPGPVASPYEQKSIGTELALCERYFIKTGQIIGTLFKDDPASRIISRDINMRATPSSTLSAENGGPFSAGSTISSTYWYARTTTANPSGSANAEVALDADF